jgi:hypothetical protein
MRNTRVARWLRGQCALRTIAVGHRMGDHILSRAPPCFARHVKPLVPAIFAVVRTHQPALGPRGGLWPVLLVGDPLGWLVAQQWGH